MTTATTPKPAETVLCRLILEADRLLSEHEGIHSMHNHRSAIVMWRECYRNGIRVDWQLVDLSIRTMRVCHATGKFPRDGEVRKRRINSPEDVL